MHMYEGITTSDRQMEEPKVLPDHTVLVATQTRQPKVLPNHAVLVAAQTRPQFKGKVLNKSNLYTCTHCGEVGHSKE